MLDLKFIKQNLEAVEKNIADRFMQADPKLVIQLYDKRNDLLASTEELRKQRNENAQKMKAKLDEATRTAYIEEGKKLKDQIADAEKELEETEKLLKIEHAKIPNMAHPDAPIGQEDKSNLQIATFGTIPKFGFAAKDHLQLGTLLDLMDFDTAAKVTGAKFYYLKNEAVLLQLALERFALEILRKHGFDLFITPDLARQSVAEGIGFNPRGEESNIYNVEGTDLCLVGTAEITLGGYYADQLLDGEKLPLKMAGLSHCFRREAGAAGQFSKGLYRVHQFSKVEMFILCSPEDSEKSHIQLLEIEKEIFNTLEIPFRIVDTCTGDLGAPAYRKYDLEAWMPGRGEQGDWGEVTSTSNCTDYQSRRLNIRFKKDGKNQFVHMLNGTAIAMSRAVIAILENFQKEDGSVAIPKALVPYTGFDVIKMK